MSPPALNRANLLLPLHLHRLGQSLSQCSLSMMHTRISQEACQRCRFLTHLISSPSEAPHTKVWDPLSTFSTGITLILCYQVNTYPERKPCKSKLICMIHLLGYVTDWTIDLTSLNLSFRKYKMGIFMLQCFIKIKITSIHSTIINWTHTQSLLTDGIVICAEYPIEST